MRSIFLGVIGILAGTVWWPKGASPSSISAESPLDALLLLGCMALWLIGGLAILRGALQLHRSERSGRVRRNGDRRKVDRRKAVHSDEERREAERVLWELGHDRRQTERRLAARREADRLEVERVLEARRKRSS